MKSYDAITVLNRMKDYAQEADVSILVVGSVGYRSAWLYHEEFEYCDDIDCVFIYKAIEDLYSCPYLEQTYIETVKCYLSTGEADMFSTKTEVNGVKISADFVSLTYLEQLAAEDFTGNNKFRIKATDAIEKDTNVYCNFWGEKIVYQKKYIDRGQIRLYELPIHYYLNDRFYPGVLLNKYLYNPLILHQARNDYKLIVFVQQRVGSVCSALQENNGVKASVENTAYKKENFSEETRQFLKEEI